MLVRRRLRNFLTIFGRNNVPMNDDLQLLEWQRLYDLRTLQIMDTSPEQAYDDIVRLAAIVTGCPMAFIGFLDEDRLWFKSRVGIEVDEVPKEQSFCVKTIEKDDMLEIYNAVYHPEFRTNPAVTGKERVRYYAGLPLFSPGRCRVGTLCVVDQEPRMLNNKQREALFILARQATDLLVQRQQSLLSECA